MTAGLPHCALPRSSQQPQLALAADQRRSRWRASPRASGSTAISRNAAHGVGLALQRSGSSGSTSTASRTSRNVSLTEQDLPRRRGLLEPRRDVHRVPGREVLSLAHQHRARC